ncbi:MAG TPA: sodium-translocating pyrophosphatase [Verrucomicrobiae bacterium]|nr:sodium-translocating pyrophosphatase [Verrucomicrobiae bacterium]
MLSVSSTHGDTRPTSRRAVPARAAWLLRALFGLLLAACASPLMAAGESELKLPDLSIGGKFLAGLDGPTLLEIGLVVSAFGLLFGLVIFTRLKKMAVHSSMLEVSELIYETCKTYLATQGKFLMILECFIAVVIVVYFGVLQGMAAYQVAIILAFSVVGISGSFAVAAFGMRVNTFANSRTAFASLTGKAYPCYDIPLQAGMSIGMMLVSIELLIMLCILRFIPGELAGKCFIGFAIGESLGAAALRVAGGIFTKIADIGSDLMKIVFKIKEDDARNPGVIADCTGDNAGDSVGPSADGFETYGVTGVALITFILLAVQNPKVQVQLLIWIFTMRVMMVLCSGIGYFVNGAIAKSRFGNAAKFNYETPLTTLVWLTSILSIVLTYAVSSQMIPDLNGDSTLWWKLATIISCGTLAGAVIPEFVKVFTSTNSRHVREIVTSSREGGASLNILSGFVAGNFSAFWLGLAMLTLMSIGYLMSTQGLHALMVSTPLPVEAVFAFGLVAFGFLGMGPVTIAVDSYGPVTDNAQSVYELSVIETLPGIEGSIEKEYGFKPQFEKAKENLEENDGAGNTFKATSKPVLIGTAVVGATTMIFATIVDLTKKLTTDVDKLSLLHPPFLLGLITGGAVIYWFTGAATQAVSTGAYRAVEFIKKNIKLEGAEKASVSDSKKVVAICTQYAQKGMLNIFLVVFFATLSFAFLEPFFFVGYLISIALFGLFQAIFMANAGGAWDNAKKVVETELRAKGTELHAATVVGDTVGDPFKDTSSVALNPIIKFTTLFGLLAVSLAVSLFGEHGEGATLTHILSAVFFLIALCFVYRSFYGMRIESGN